MTPGPAVATRRRAPGCDGGVQGGVGRLMFLELAVGPEPRHDRSAWNLNPAT